MYLIIIWFTNQFLKISLSLELSFSDYSNFAVFSDHFAVFFVHKMIHFPLVTTSAAVFGL